MYRFIINEQLPSLNDYINKLKSPKGKQVGAAFKKRIDDICISYILPHRRQLTQICKQPVIIFFQWHEKSKRRDLDNVYSAKKYILDAMQKAGVLENDNATHVKGLFDGVTYGKRDYVEITVFTEADKLDYFIEQEKKRLKGAGANDS